jgi:hypothetical protein
MSISQRFNMLLLGVIFSSVAFSPALCRQWKPTPVQLAGEYAAINHNITDTEFVNIRWWAEPTVRPGTPVSASFQKYILISVVRAHTNFPGGTITTEDVDTLEVRDSNDMPLTPVPRDALPPTAIATIVGLEAATRQAIGRLGQGTKFVIFDAGTVHACEKGLISVPLSGETYTWETPFPGCWK